MVERRKQTLLSRGYSLAISDLFEATYCCLKSSFKLSANTTLY